MNVTVPLGTRPEIIKLAPVVHALRRRGVTVRVVATGQHHDASLTDTFFDALELHPDAQWSLHGDMPARVAGILEALLRELSQHPCDLVLTLGDTYTVPLACLAARRHRIPVAHVEAGLRSFNATSMEEVDRRVAAATASLHFAPTDLAARFLQDEGVPADRIFVVGNPIVDVLREHGPDRRSVADRRGVLLTAHRPTNVDDRARLTELVVLAERLAADGPVTFPVHPRTRQRLQAAGSLGRLRDAGVVLTEPLPYEEMLDLVAGARVVVTDSGGLQEEAAWLGVPVVVLRHSTPRWEGVAAGTAVLTGLDADRAHEAVRRLGQPEAQHRAASAPCPYGDGDTGPQIAAILTDPDTAPLLRLDEPDFVGAPPPGLLEALR